MRWVEVRPIHEVVGGDSKVFRWPVQMYAVVIGDWPGGHWKNPHYEKVDEVVLGEQKAYELAGLVRTLAKIDKYPEWPKEFWGGGWMKVIDGALVENEDGDRFEIDISRIADSKDGFVRIDDEDDK